MQKSFRVFSLTTAFLVLGWYRAHAIIYFPTISMRRTYGTTELFASLNQVVFIAWMVLIAVATIFFMVGGYRYLRAGGDPAQAKAATMTIVYGLVALAVGLVARGLVFLVEDLIR